MLAHFLVSQSAQSAPHQNKEELSRLYEVNSLSFNEVWITLMLTGAGQTDVLEGRTRDSKFKKKRKNFWVAQKEQK